MGCVMKGVACMTEGGTTEWGPATSTVSSSQSRRPEFSGTFRPQARQQPRPRRLHRAEDGSSLQDGLYLFRIQVAHVSDACEVGRLTGERTEIVPAEVFE